MPTARHRELERRSRPRSGTGFGALVATLLLVLVGNGCSREPEPATPSQAWRAALGDQLPDELNVILVTIDTLRVDRLSSYGSQRVETPHIDRLAREGVQFLNAASTVPFTLPAHSSLMTGTYPPYHGVRENVGYTLSEDLPTLAEAMSASGRQTAGFVSAFVLDSRWGIGRGFAHYHDDFDLPEGGSASLGSVQRDGAETIAAAIAWLDERPPGPFFLWLHLYDPHDPYKPSEPWRSRYPDSPYDAEVAYTDALIGEFRQALDDRDILETSLLVLTADHGEGLGQHREGFHGFFIYDSTMRVPLIVRAPHRTLAGRVVSDAVSHVDLLPTLLAAVEQPIPKFAQGSSALPLILGQPESEVTPRAVYSESLYPLLHYGWSPLRAIRRGRYKFNDAPRPELYDLETDPREQHNILLDERRTSRELKDALDALAESIESDAVQADPADMDEETLRQLQALGYVAGRGDLYSQDVEDHERVDPKDRIEIHQLVMAAQSDVGAGQPDKAEAKLRRALETDPELLDAHQMLGTIALQVEAWNQAIEHFQASLAQQSDHEASLFGLATAYRRLGRSNDALLGYQRLLEVNPQDTKAVLAATDLLLEADRAAEAHEILDRALADERPAPVVLSRKGELVLAEGNRSEAVSLFAQAIGGNPDLVPALFNLAVLREEDGQLDAATGYYERTVELAPTHYQAMFNLGRLLGQQGQPERQQELWQAAIDANPDFLRGYYYLAKLIMDRGGDLQRAESLARDALARDDQHVAGPLGYYVLADILNRQGRPHEAAEAAEAGRQIRVQNQQSG